MTAITSFLRNNHFSSLTLILLWLVIMNLIAFFSMGRDKQKARRGAWRTPESVLFLQAILGGSIGSLLGMFVFRHKTRKWKFRIGMPLILIVQILLVLLLVQMSSRIIFL